MAATSTIQERRRFPRAEAPARWSVNLLQPQGFVAVESVNMSEGGVCFRLAEMLEIRSLVRLQLSRGMPPREPRAVECTGRVAWVIQRLDLRPAPPFLFDVGVEFVNPPTPLRRWITQQPGAHAAAKPRGGPDRLLEPAQLRSRQYLPRLTRESAHPSRWHLIVTVDGAPCFSGHYPSERSALASWAKFKRQQTRAAGRRNARLVT